MNIQALEHIYRACNVINIIRDSYQIYHNERLGSWEKVCRITPRLFGFAADSALLTNPVYPSIKSADLNKLRIVSATSNVTSSVSDMTFSNEAISLRDIGSIGISVIQIVDQTGISSRVTEALPTLEGSVSLMISFQEIISKRESIKKVLLTFVQNLNTPNYEQRVQEEIIKLSEHIRNTEGMDWRVCIQNTVEDCEKILNNEPAIAFGRIPYSFLDQEEFQRRRCAITNQPIREAVVIKETTTSSPIYYEYISLPNWRRDKRGVLPPSWPASIPFTLHAIVLDETETAHITEALQIVLDSVQRDPVKQENIRITLTAIPVLIEALRQTSANASNTP